MMPARLLQSLHAGQAVLGLVILACVLAIWVARQIMNERT